MRQSFLAISMIGVTVLMSAMLGSASADQTDDEFNDAQRYLNGAEYSKAEERFRNFLGRHPADHLAPKVMLGLGEALFRQEKYRDAAEALVVLVTKYEGAPESMHGAFRLGQSMAALKEKGAACASIAVAIKKTYIGTVGLPKLRQEYEREQTRLGCQNR